VIFGLAINLSNEVLQVSEKNDLTDWITSIGTLLSVAAAIGIAFYSFILTRRTEKKQGLKDVFKTLNDNAHRNARRRIVNLYGESNDDRKRRILRVMGVSDEQIKNMYTLILESEEIVKTDFDQIGSLIKVGAVPENEFLRIYYNEVLRCWSVLAENIDAIRIQNNHLEYMEGFELLKLKAEEYKGSAGEIDVKKDIDVEPRIEEFIPKANEIILRFDQPMDRTTIDIKNFILTDIHNARIGLKVILVPNHDNIVRLQGIDLNGPADYTLVIKRDLKDADGFTLSKDIPKTFYIPGSSIAAPF